MSTYIVTSTYHRRLNHSELDIAIGSGRGLLIIGKDGAHHFEDRPSRFKRDQLASACDAGRVYLPWASRTTFEDELPAAAEPVEVEDSKEPVTI